jgi:hypothetical protein
MPELTIPISLASHKTLLTLVESSGHTTQAILDRAIENYRRQIFLEQANEAFVRLRQNEALWEDELAERQDWEMTIADGVSGGEN